MWAPDPWARSESSAEHIDELRRGLVAKATDPAQKALLLTSEPGPSLHEQKAAPSPAAYAAALLPLLGGRILEGRAPPGPRRRGLAVAPRVTYAANVGCCCPIGSVLTDEGWLDA